MSTQEHDMKDAENSVADAAGQEEHTGEKPAGAARDNAEIPLPKVDFSTFLLSMASSALVQLGEVPSPENGKKEENLPLAKHTIDMLCMLQDKIANGLTQEETRLLEGILYELRLKYVIKSQ
jgi:hypothetical protein